MSSFENLRVVDNFYQTSLLFPMPTVVISTLCEDGTTTLGPYSLVQPYYVAGKDYYAMLLSCRNSSNTAQNILRNGKCAINFVDDKPKTFKECVKLSWPGDKPEDKMPACQFKLEKGQAEGERPMVLTDAIQVIECTWVRELDNAQNDAPGCLNGYEPPYHDFNGITSKFGAHFILKVDKILMKKKYHDAIINGVKAKDFPNLPVDYGYRDSKNFWFHRKTRMRAELLPIYGYRLGGYLAIREFKSSSYKKNMTGEIKEGSTVPFGVKIAIWVTCALLYVTQVAGVFYRFENYADDNAFVFIGALITLCGVALETAADIQKNNAKKINPRRFVDTGLYRIVRCPNYLGEMIFWTGVLISGIGAVETLGQWIVVLIGYIGIIFVMFSGARRLEIRQDKNYGADPEYQKYVTTVPILLPFIPLYSVKKHKWLVA